jgi:hypothetical protein
LIAEINVANESGEIRGGFQRWNARCPSRSAVFRPHGASALDANNAFRLQRAALIQPTFGRNGKPIVESGTSTGFDRGRRVYLHNFSVAGFQGKFRAANFVDDAAEEMLRRGRGCLTPRGATRTRSARERRDENPC